jgi:hypothetical protein
MTLARLGNARRSTKVYRAGKELGRCDLEAMASIAGRDPPGWLVCEQVHSHVRIGSRKWKQADDPDETPRNVRIENGQSGNSAAYWDHLCPIEPGAEFRRWVNRCSSASAPEYAEGPGKAGGAPHPTNSMQIRPRYLARRR